MAGAKGSKQRRRKHGLVALRRAIEGSIDPHSKLGLALAGLRNTLVADLGGHDGVSEAQRLVIDRVIRAKLRADAADAWLDTQPVENRLDARVLAIEREARAQGEAMVRYLGMLGLQRQAAPVTFEQHMALLSAVPGGLPGAGGPRIRLSGERRSPIDPSPTTCRFYGRCPEGFDRCRTEMPVLRVERGEHAVACHLSSAQESGMGVVGATLAEVPTVQA